MLARCLAALREQTLDAERFEVVVVDDGSTDETARVLAGAAHDRGPALEVVRHASSRGASAARNAGWRRARAPVVAFTDDDCVPVAGWLAAGLAACAAAPGAIVQGRIDPLPSERHLLGPFSRTLSVPGPAPTFATANVFYPRALIERLGGFDEHMTTGEDTDLAWRGFA